MDFDADRFIFEGRQLSYESVEAMVRDRDPESRWQAATISNLPEIFIEILAVDPVVFVRTEVANRDDLGQQHIETLSLDPHEDPRRHIAAHDLCDGDVLVRLLNDASPLVRSWARSSKNLSPGVLAKAIAAEAEAPPARTQTQSQPVVAEGLLELIADPDYQVRLQAVKVMRLTPEALVRLDKDGSGKVRRAARSGNLPTGWKPWVVAGWSFRAIAKIASTELFELEPPRPDAVEAFVVLAEIGMSLSASIAR